MSIASCIACPAGTFSTQGAVDCVPSPEGTYQEFIRSSASKPCTKGTFNNLTGTQSITACKPCPLRAFSSEGLRFCGSYSVGTYGDTMELARYKLCPLGTSSDKSRIMSVEQCVWHVRVERLVSRVGHPVLAARKAHIRIWWARRHIKNAQLGRMAMWRGWEV